MPSSSPNVARARRAARPSCPPLQETGNSGVNARRMRTTCDVAQAANRMADAARVWLRIKGRSASKAEFVDEAIGALTRKLMAENPDFKLPPDLDSFDFMPSMEPKNTNGGNS